MFIIIILNLLIFILVLSKEEIKSFAVEKLQQKFKSIDQTNEDSSPLPSSSRPSTSTNFSDHIHQKYEEMMSGTSQKWKEYKKGDHFRKEINEFDKTQHLSPTLNNILESIRACQVTSTESERVFSLISGENYFFV
jgi:hypothetical protein